MLLKLAIVLKLLSKIKRSPTSPVIVETELSAATFFLNVKPSNSKALQKTYAQGYNSVPR